MDADPPSADGEDVGPAGAARRRQRPSGAFRRLDFDGAGAGGTDGTPEIDEMHEGGVGPISPLQLFEKFITPEMQARICDATNVQAERYQTSLSSHSQSQALLTCLRYRPRSRNRPG